MERLYLEYAPDPTGLTYLTDLQRQLGLTDSSSKVVGAHEQHLTLIHFGIVDKVYHTLSKTVTMTPEVYLAAVKRFADQAAALLTGPIVAEPDSIVRFGRDGHIVVLTLTVSDEVRALQRQCVELLADCLRACGASDPYELMRSDTNFQHALTFNPHITLARNVDIIAEVPPQRKKLLLRPVPVNYDMKHGRYT